MKRGLAPQRFNFKKGDMESMDLSFVTRWPEGHTAIGPFRRANY